MAKKKGASPKVIKATAKELQDAIRDAAGAKQRAVSANANKTNALADYALKSGFSKPALALVLKLHGLEDIKRTDFVREILMAHQMMGWGEQSDLFDDIGELIAAATKRAEEAEASRKGKSTGTPGLPIEELAKGIKPLDDRPKGSRAKSATPTEAMREGAAEGDAFLRSQRRPRNALPDDPPADVPAQRKPEVVH